MAALHGSQAFSGDVGDFVDGLCTQVGDLMLLEVRPDVFNRIEFRCIGRQVIHDDATVHRRYLLNGRHLNQLLQDPA